MGEKQVRYDVDGVDVVTEAIRSLINDYPGLNTGEEIAFSVLADDYGKAMFPSAGAVITRESESVTGHVVQICAYPFFVIYRVGKLSESRKAAVKEWLDNFGRWLEKQPVKINGQSYRLEEYPALTGDRKFNNITRQTTAYLDSINDNMSENWAISIQASYINEFDK